MIITALFISSGSIVAAIAIVRYVRTQPKPLQDAIKETFGPDACDVYVRKTWPSENRSLTALDDNRGRSYGYFSPRVLLPPGTSAELFSVENFPFESVEAQRSKEGK